MSRQTSVLTRSASSSLLVASVGGQFVVEQKYQWADQSDVDSYNGHTTINGTSKEVKLNTKCSGEVLHTWNTPIDICTSIMDYEEPYAWRHMKATYDADKKVLTQKNYKSDKCEEECSEEDSDDEITCYDEYKQEPFKCAEVKDLAHVIVNVYQDEECKEEDVVMKNVKLASFECDNSGSLHYTSSYYSSDEEAEEPEWRWSSKSATFEDGEFSQKSFSGKNCKSADNDKERDEYLLTFKSDGSCQKISDKVFRYKSTKMHIKSVSSQETNSGFSVGLAPLAAIAAAYSVFA